MKDKKLLSFGEDEENEEDVAIGDHKIIFIFHP